MAKYPQKAPECCLMRKQRMRNTCKKYGKTMLMGSKSKVRVHACYAYKILLHAHNVCVPVQQRVVCATAKSDSAADLMRAWLEEGAKDEGKSVAEEWRLQWVGWCRESNSQAKS